MPPMEEVLLPCETQSQFCPPLLAPALKLLEEGIKEFFAHSSAQRALQEDLRTFAGRATPLTLAPRLGKLYGGKIYLKREDLLHGGAHKLNNALGQCHLAKFMGFKHIIAETGAGQHGVATAMAASRLGLTAVVYQGAKDVKRQQLNALRMKLFGATLIQVEDGQATLKEAVNAAFRSWVGSYKTHAYCIGSIVGPHPYPKLVRQFQSCIGQETLAQFRAEEGNNLPHAVFACVGGGSNAAGMFTPFEPMDQVKLVGCEAAGAASLTHGTPGVLQGMYSLILQTSERNIAPTHSVSAGLDYPGVGPYLAGLKLQGRLNVLAIEDQEALNALRCLAEQEGILCALESAHAIAGAQKYLSQNRGHTVVINVSGRGDKDLGILSQKFEHLLTTP